MIRYRYDSPNLIVSYHVWNVNRYFVLKYDDDVINYIFYYFYWGWITRADEVKLNGFAPGVTPLRCLDIANRDKKRKDRNKAGIVISRDKL